MQSWFMVDPVRVCGDKFANGTIAFHECLCQYKYDTIPNSVNRKMGVLKFKHCALADELRRQSDFNMYQIIGFSVLVFVIVAIVLFLTFKWYQQTKKCPCGGLFSRCFSNDKHSPATTHTLGHDVTDRNAGFDERWMHVMQADAASFSLQNGGLLGAAAYHGNGKRARGRKSLCMKFCLSDPVQDCCEFFDCDLLWRKKTIYSVPYFGRPRGSDPEQCELNSASTPPPPSLGHLPHNYLHKPVDEEPSTLQRRPTRPAPPPPKLPGVPGSAQFVVPLYDDDGHIDDMIECEPVPEAPPSPEPMTAPITSTQHVQPRSLYVDPLSFLKTPFVRLSIALSGRDGGKGSKEEESDPIYSRVRDFVMSKVRKSGSVLSLNKGTVSTHPDGNAVDGGLRTRDCKGGLTASLSSLHDITENELDKSCSGSKRSMSLASLQAHNNTQNSILTPSGGASRTQSRSLIADEDVPPMRRDEYVDLEEMARKIAARQQARQQNNAPTLQSVSSQPLSVQAFQSYSPAASQVSPSGSSTSGRTPDFITASAYSQPKTPQPAPFEIGPSALYPPQSSTTAANNVNVNCSTLGAVPNVSSLQTPEVTSAFALPNYTSFQTSASVASTVNVSATSGGRVTQPASPLSVNSDAESGFAPNNVVPGTLVPYTGPSITTQSSTTSSTSPYVPLSQVMPNGNSTMGRNSRPGAKPTVPPRPGGLDGYSKSATLGRAVPPSPKVIDPRRGGGSAAAAAMAAAAAAAAATGGIPVHSPLLAGGRPTAMPPPPPINPLLLHEQQLLQQQLLQQQLYMQNPHLQQMLFQSEHTIVTPSVQQQLLQEHQQQLYHQMLAAQQQQFLQQQYLQQQYFQQQFHPSGPMRYRQPLSSTSSTASSASTKSSRSVFKPNHPPPPPPTSGAACSSSGAPIESSI